MRTHLRCAVLSLAVFAGCDAKASGDQVEKKIAELAKAKGVEFAKITCPKSIKVEVKGTFECQATTTAGETLRVIGTITSKSGSNFEYSIEFPDPTYLAEKVASTLHDELAKQEVGAPKSVDCGKPGVYKIPADGKVKCTVVDPSDKTVTVTVKFTPDGDFDSWEVGP